MTYIQNPLSYQAPVDAGKLSKRQLEIISKASELLSKKGSEGLTIKNLAKEMKFSEAALYRHFTSKEKIIIAMLENLILQLDDLLSALNREQSPKDRYYQYFQHLFDFFNTHKRLADIATLDGLLGKSVVVQLTLNGISNILQKHLIPIVMDGKLSGDFPMALNADRIIHILLGTFRFQMQKWTTSKHQFDLVRTSNDLMGSLLILFQNQK